MGLWRSSFSSIAYGVLRTPFILIVRVAVYCYRGIVSSIHSLTRRGGSGCRPPRGSKGSHGPAHLFVCIRATEYTGRRSCGNYRDVRPVPAARFLGIRGEKAAALAPSDMAVISC